MGGNKDSKSILKPVGRVIAAPIVVSTLLAGAVWSWMNYNKNAQLPEVLEASTNTFNSVSNSLPRRYMVTGESGELQLAVEDDTQGRTIFYNDIDGDSWADTRRVWTHFDGKSQVSAEEPIAPYTVRMEVGGRK